MSRGPRLILCLVTAAAADPPAAPPADAPVRVRVDADAPLRRVDPRFFGANTLFMYDDDRALADGKIARLLRDLPCGLLRYPGGDVADNYLWKTHRIDNREWWPRLEGEETTDTDEFMRFCRAAGAEPIFVANLENGFVHGDIDAAARYAAEWVRHCNVEHRYGVRLWEIGNETYLYHPGPEPAHKRARVTAAAYAEAFVKFSRAMKAVDPQVLTGAIGPNTPVSSCNNRLPDGGTASPREPPWWPTVVERAGPEIGFVVVHSYHGGANLDYETLARKGLRNDAFLEELRPWFDAALGRRVPIALTEWNLDRETPLRGMAAGQAIVEMAGRFLTAGVDYAGFWPLRLRGGNAGFRPLLDADSSEPLIAWRALRMAARCIGGELLKASASEEAVYPLAWRTADGSLAALLVHKSPGGGARTVAVELEGFDADRSFAASMAAPAADADEARGVAVTFSNRGKRWLGELPPYSITLVQFSR